MESISFHQEEIINIGRKLLKGGIIMVQNKKLKNIATTSTVLANEQISEKILDEVRFHASGGTGFAAEQANSLYDNLTLHPAKIVGDNNAKNGADRLVGFTPVQTKYYSTAKASVNAAFENHGSGKYRYVTNHGRVMDLEVPKDQYDDAVEIMRNKILAGQVAGVTDPGQADDIVRAGHYTYSQAKNIAEAGTIDSIAYDVMDGAVVGLTAFGISSVINYGLMVIRGEDKREAAKAALKNGGKVGGIALASTAVAGQISKSCSTDFINTVGAGSIATCSTLLVLSTVDVVKVFNGQITSERATRNLGCNAVGLIAGKKGYEIGAALGTTICPGIGTVIGGIFGAYIVGSVARGVTESLLESFFGNSEDKIRKLFNVELNRVANEYILSKEELDTLCTGLVKNIDEKFLDAIKKCPNPKIMVAIIVDRLAQIVTKNRSHVTTFEIVENC